MARAVLATVVVIGMLSGPEPPAHVHTRHSVADVWAGPDTGPGYVSPLLQLGDVPGPVIDPDPGPVVLDVNIDVAPEPEPEPEPEPPPVAVSRPAPVPTPPTGGAVVGPCGGDYPPCYVAARESGNRYDVVNWGGCGGANCYGRWQFGGFWAGKLGLPADISQATPAQQDEAARLLWNGGRGCSNWAAC